MSLRRLTVLLPCHSLDDFPTYLHGAEATSLLAGWTALWHPSLIAACGALPTWRRADDPPDPNSLEGDLVVVPRNSARYVPSGWLDRLGATHPTNPLPITDFDSRDEIIATAVQRGLLEGDSDGPVDPGDYFALGFCYLQTELLSRAMHYTEVIDAVQLKTAVVAAASATVAGDSDTALENLGNAFDLLTQARQHFYPVDSYIVDVTLVAPSTWGDALRGDLESDLPSNVLATAAMIEQLGVEHPATLAALRSAIDRGTARVVGGLNDDVSLWRMSPEELHDEFGRGRTSYERHLGCAVNVFAQYRSDTTPLTPQVLRSLGFAGALLTTFDGHSAPANDRSRCEWVGADGATLDALWSTPLDTSADDTLLGVSERIYQAMQHDHVATLLLAGWSGHRSPYYEDWRRSARFGPVLGKFITLDDYFAESADSEYWVAPQVSVNENKSAWDQGAMADSPATDHETGVRTVYRQLLAGLADVVSEEIDDSAAKPSAASSLGTILKTVAEGEPHGGSAQSVGDAPAALAVNAWSFPCTVRADEATDDSLAMVNHAVPGMGFQWLYSSAPPAAPFAQDNRLCNEHLEVVLSRTTGGIQSLKSHRDRRTRASQRLVYVDDWQAEHRRAFESPAGSSRMELDALEVTQNDATQGAISTRGRLLINGDRLIARYAQVVTLPRAARHLLLEVSLEWVEQPVDERQQTYFANRLLWNDPSASLARSVNWLRQPAEGNRILSPDWVEIASSDSGSSLTVYPLGMARHVRMGDRALDTLFPVSQDTATRYRLAIGLDDRYPTQSALELLTPGSHSVTTARHSSGPRTGWFLNVRPRNVVVTHLARISQPQPGCVLRLLETEGRSANITVAAWRPLSAGRSTDFVGQTVETLNAQEGEIAVEAGPFQWIQLEVYW